MINSFDRNCKVIELQCQFIISYNQFYWVLDVYFSSKIRMSMQCYLWKLFFFVLVVTMFTNLCIVIVFRSILVLCINFKIVSFSQNFLFGYHIYKLSECNRFLPRFATSFFSCPFKIKNKYRHYEIETTHLSSVLLWFALFYQPKVLSVKL